MFPRVKDVIEGLVENPDVLVTNEEFEASFSLDNDDDDLDEVFDFLDEISSA